MTVEFKATTTANRAEEVSVQLQLLGAAAVTFSDAGDQPIYEPTPDAPLWDNTIVTAYFETADITSLTNFAKSLQADDLIKDFQIEILKEQDWVRVSLDQFTPMQFGKRLWVCPGWHKIPDPNAINVILDPGLAFGTGTHETTTLCLEWLETNLTPGTTLIDYGCGSGILAIAAIKLGARLAIAIDHDPQALLATTENGIRNNITTSQLLVYPPDNEIPHLPVDYVVANILASPLITLAPRFANYLKKDGKLILSGILPEQVEMIKKAYQEWFDIEDITIGQQWVLMLQSRDH